MPDALGVKRRVEAEPVPAGGPADQVDAGGARAARDPGDDGVDVPHDLDRADERRIRLRRLRHRRGPRRAAVAAGVHDEGRMAGGGEVCCQRPARDRAGRTRRRPERGRREEGGSASGSPRARSRRAHLADEEPDPGVSVDEVVGADERFGARRREPEDRRKQDCQHRDAELTPDPPRRAGSRRGDGRGARRSGRVGRRRMRRGLSGGLPLV